jgi:hypothetical protein
MTAVIEVGLKPGKSIRGEAKFGQFEEKKIMVNSVKSFRDVQEHYTYELLVIESFVPVVQAMEEKDLS